MSYQYSGGNHKTMFNAYQPRKTFKDGFMYRVWQLLPLIIIVTAVIVYASQF